MSAIDTPLEVRALTKRYSRRTVLDDLNFVVNPGTITGFLGPNGAGKSTTMRILMGLDRPTSGEALINGVPITSLPAPGSVVGAVLGNRCAHPGRAVIDSMRWAAKLLDVPESACWEQLDRVDLVAAARKPTKHLSLGMRQRLALAIALLGNPQILLLDEPMNGLDPPGITWLRGLLDVLRANGHTILLASHLLREIEDLVDDLVVVVDGRIVKSGSMAEFRESFRGQAVTVGCDDVQGLVAEATKRGGQVRGELRGDRVTLVGLSAKELGHIARDANIIIEEMVTESGLERVFEAATHNSRATSGNQA